MQEYDVHKVKNCWLQNQGNGKLSYSSETFYQRALKPLKALILQGRLFKGQENKFSLWVEQGILPLIFYGCLFWSDITCYRF